MLKVKNCVKSDLEIILVFFSNFRFLRPEYFPLCPYYCETRLDLSRTQRLVTKPTHAISLDLTDYKNNKNYSEKSDRTTLNRPRKSFFILCILLWHDGREFKR